MVECERILSSLLEKTPETHRDYSELSKVAGRFKQVCFVQLTVLSSDLKVGWLKQARANFISRVCSLSRMHLTSAHSTLTSNTKCPFKSKPLLPISDNTVRVKVNVIFSLW